MGIIHQEKNGVENLKNLLNKINEEKLYEEWQKQVDQKHFNASNQIANAIIENYMNAFKKIKKIHFVGIGGAGMIGIARVLLQKGYKISGSDISMSADLNKLKNEGAKVYLGS